MVLRNEWMEDLGEKKKFFHAEDIKSNYSSDYLKKFTSLLLLMELSSTFHKHKQKKKEKFYDFMLCFFFSHISHSAWLMMGNCYNKNETCKSFFRFFSYFVFFFFISSSIQLNNVFFYVLNPLSETSEIRKNE
jgi:hypothetical protein